VNKQDRRKELSCGKKWGGGGASLKNNSKTLMKGVGFNSNRNEAARERENKPKRGQANRIREGGEAERWV